MRGSWGKCFFGLAALLAPASLLRASGDAGTEATYDLAKPWYDPYGASMVLGPANDTRVNLALLLADRGRGSFTPGERALPFFSWKDFQPSVANGAGSGETAGELSYGKCQTLRSGAAAFSAAVIAARLAPNERASLIGSRSAVTAECARDHPTAGLVKPPAVTSPLGRAFKVYIEGAQAFYDGDFPTATGKFRTLAGAGDPWLAETAAYMVARSELNRAIAASIDEYGSLAEIAKRDQSATAAARAQLGSYLKAYPKGRYAASAQGLMRRVYWLGGQQGPLSQTYGAMLSPAASPMSLYDLLNEIDNKLDFFEGDITDPALLAVADLARLRSGDRWEGDPSLSSPPSVTRAILEKQKPRFATAPALFAYLQAAEAFYGRKSPREVLGLIPDAAHQTSLSNLEFSRQMLRGFALEALSDRNVRGFWLSLLPAAKLPKQRAAVELALATHDERHDLGQVFAPGSHVTTPAIREVLLTYTAGPDLLRRQASAGASNRERDVARYILLAKEVRRGLYAPFLADLKDARPGQKSDYGFVPASLTTAEYDPASDAVPFADFFNSAGLGEYGCSAIGQTAAVLAREPMQPHARLCLGEFFRVGGFDWSWPYDAPLERGLAASKPQFPGKPIDRKDIYTTIIADARAPAEDRAFALYRAVRCYAPAGSNDCGGDEVPMSQRKAWYDQLKAQYPQSRWAKALRYYW